MEEMALYADVIINISHEKLDRPFQYSIPPELSDRVTQGSAVIVPFGAGNREIKGFVIGISDTPGIDCAKIKSIIRTDDDTVSPENGLVMIAAWIKKNYGGTMIQALKTVLPVKEKQKTLTRRVVTLNITDNEAIEKSAVFASKHQLGKARALEALSDENMLPYELLTQKKNIAPSTLQSLVKAGIITVTEQDYYRNPVKGMERGEIRNILSPVQKNIIDTVMEGCDAGKPGRFLIHGITGSGKTEVYLGIAEEMAVRGLQTIVLIPEIALTYQTLLRFYRRFGDRVSVVNSTMSKGERYDQFVRAREGRLDVIIGPRSALFTPFPGLGAVIIDEEHETSYKSENCPRYHARETAEELTDVRGASLILGSATPSLESYYRAQTGRYTLFEMDERLTGGSLPQVDTVDMRAELKGGNRSIFSFRLQKLLGECFGRGEQAMLFINRRGVAGFVSCRACGHVMKCPHCDVSMTEHRDGRLVCHYCGYSVPKPKVCPECGSPYIAGFRAGTEQIETEINRLMPEARTIRMDADTTARKGSYEKILQTFADGDADILIGTQMIVKGHDFPNVTLVGILAADLSLNLGDYRAAERTFQLLTQAAGRAGRGMRPGRVVIQTYQPDNYSIVHAAEQDYKGFYQQEMAYRQLLDYPPAAHMLAVLVSSPDVKRGEDLSHRLADISRDILYVPGAPDGAEEDAGVREGVSDIGRGIIIGPAPASISMIQDQYRFVMYVKHRSYGELVKVKDACENECQRNLPAGVYVQYDFDPLAAY